MSPYQTNLPLIQRSFRIRQIPVRLGGGWSIQCIEQGRIVYTHHEKPNYDINCLPFHEQLIHNLALCACQLEGERYMNTGIYPFLSEVTEVSA